MDLKNIGILLALCATLAVAIDHDDKSPPEHGQYHGPNNPNYPVRNRMESMSDENLPMKEHHGHHGYKPHPAHNSEESHESHEWEKEKHLHRDTHVPQNPELSKGFEGMEARRRPLGFYPYGLHYPYYPHAYPSHNDDEFETIEAKARGNFHGHHNPHFPLNFDDSQESDEAVPFWFFHYKPHFPQFPLFHKPAPETPEINSDEDSQTLDETNVEGSGEEEIIPLSDNAADIILLREEDDATEDQINEQDEDNEPSNDASAVDLISILETRKSIPVDCDALNTPRYSCHNCYNYVVCKPEGGKIKQCKDPLAPYCNKGVCSNTPGPECTNL